MKHFRLRLEEVEDEDKDSDTMGGEKSFGKLTVCSLGDFRALFSH